VTANVLLNFMMCLHVIVEVCHLSKGPTTVNFNAAERSLA
jgi:hypothetical protein